MFTYWVVSLWLMLIGKCFKNNNFPVPLAHQQVNQVKTSCTLLKAERENKDCEKQQVLARTRSRYRNTRFFPKSSPVFLYAEAKRNNSFQKVLRARALHAAVELRFLSK